MEWGKSSKPSADFMTLLIRTGGTTDYIFVSLFVFFDKTARRALA